MEEAMPGPKVEVNITEQTTVNGIIHTRAPDTSYIDAKGAFGIVQLIISRQNYESFAIKTVKKMTGSTTGYEQVQREIQIMKKLSHPHIVKLYEVLETPKKVHLVLELCAGGELVKQIRKQQSCSEEDCLIIITRLSDAISYLHRQGIVHRDIKPENILLSTENPNDKWNIKLSDFGLATSTNACTMMENVCGTPLYMAPEIIQNLGYSSQCDVWSVGVMMLCGYQKEAETDLIHMIQANEIKYPEKYWAKISNSGTPKSNSARLLVDLMLRSDPAKRITSSEVLLHPWITGSTSNGSKTQNFNVLDLMKSYNAESRFRTYILFVRAAIRWSKLIKQIESPISGTGANTPSVSESFSRLNNMSQQCPKQEKESMGNLHQEKTSTRSKEPLFVDTQSQPNLALKKNALTPSPSKLKSSSPTKLTSGSSASKLVSKANSAVPMSPRAARGNSVSSPAHARSSSSPRKTTTTKK